MPGQEGEVDAAVTRSSVLSPNESPRGQELGARVDLALPVREPIIPSAATSFGPKSWFQPPPEPPVPDVALDVQELPKPSAPPLPYRYVGTIKLGDGRELFHVMSGETLRVLSIGDTVDQEYKVEDSDVNALVFTYLPLGERQYLYFGKD